MRSTGTLPSSKCHSSVKFLTSSHQMKLDQTPLSQPLGTFLNPFGPTLMPIRSCVIMVPMTFEIAITESAPSDTAMSHLRHQKIPICPSGPSAADAPAFPFCWSRFLWSVSRRLDSPPSCWELQAVRGAPEQRAKKMIDFSICLRYKYCVCIYICNYIDMIDM